LLKIVFTFLKIRRFVKKRYKKNVRDENGNCDKYFCTSGGCNWTSVLGLRTLRLISNTVFAM
jgi:hypothetical protein